jgi:hypothetical protein
MRKVRALSRQAAADGRRVGMESQDYRDAYDEAIENGVEEEEAKRLAREAGEGSDEVAEVNNASLAKQLSIMLVDDNQQPVVEAALLKHLAEDIDARDIEGLMNYVLSNEDPTSPPSTTTSTESTTP